MSLLWSQFPVVLHLIHSKNQTPYTGLQVSIQPASPTQNPLTCLTLFTVLPCSFHSSDTDLSSFLTCQAHSTSQPHCPLCRIAGLYSVDANTTPSSPPTCCSYMSTWFTPTTQLALESGVRLPLKTWYKISPSPSQPLPRLYIYTHTPYFSSLFFPKHLYFLMYHIIYSIILLMWSLPCN